MRISDWSSDVCSSDLFRIDHHGRTQLAAVEAAGLVDPHPLEAELLHPRLQVVAQPDRPFGLAAAALVTRRTLVHAAEDVTAAKGFRVTLGGHFGVLARHGLFRGFPHNLLLSFLLLVASGCRHHFSAGLLEFLPPFP